MARQRAHSCKLHIGMQSVITDGWLWSTDPSKEVARALGAAKCGSGRLSPEHIHFDADRGRKVANIVA